MRRKVVVGCFSIFGLLILGVIGFVGFSLYSVYQEYRSPETLADADGQFTDVNGVRIYYIARGKKENPAVILIHGFGGSTFTWRDNLDALAEDYYVVALDLPPFGLSDKSPTIGYSRADFAAYVAGLMDNLGIETASIVGHSMGGTVASYFVVNYPERVDKLVLVDGGIFEGTVDENRGESPLAFLNNIDPSSPLTADIMRLSLRPSTFAEIMSSAYYDPNFVTEEIVAGYARPLQIQEWPYGFLGFLQVEQGQVVSLEDFANAATMPSLLIWGNEDTWVPIATGEGIRDVLSDVDFISYPNVGHLPMEENARQFNHDLLEFLGE